MRDFFVCALEIVGALILFPMRHLVVGLLYLLLSTGVIVSAQVDEPAFMYVPSGTRGPVYLPHHSWRCVVNYYQIKPGFVSDPKSKAAWLASLAAYGVKLGEGGFLVYHEEGTLLLAATPEDHERIRTLSSDQTRPYLNQSPQRMAVHNGFTATIHGPPPLSLSR